MLGEVIMRIFAAIGAIVVAILLAVVGAGAICSLCNEVERKLKFRNPQYESDRVRRYREAAGTGLMLSSQLLLILSLHNQILSLPLGCIYLGGTMVGVLTAIPVGIAGLVLRAG